MKNSSLWELEITIFWHIQCVPYTVYYYMCKRMYCGDRCTEIYNILCCVPYVQCEKYGQCLSNGIYDVIIIPHMGMTIFFFPWIFPYENEWIFLEFFHMKMSEYQHYFNTPSWYEKHKRKMKKDEYLTRECFPTHQSGR